jgi:hypothetical protein
MTFISKFPPGCARLDLRRVAEVLTKHRADICAGAKELGVSRTDLRRLTWHDPKLLHGAYEAIDLYAIRCQSLMIQELSSPRRRIRERATDQILASSLAAGHPLATAPAPKPMVKSNKPPSEFILEMRRRRSLSATNRTKDRPSRLEPSP